MHIHLPGIDSLFDPFTFSSLTLPNRFVMAPMTRERSPDGVPTRENIEYYRARAAGGIGLIVTEGAYIDRADAGPSTAVPRLAGGEHARQWAKVIDAVHSQGASIIPQLWHTGIARGASHLSAPSVSPSGRNLDGVEVASPLSTIEIDCLVEDFARAASLARDIGFDGVEIHGAHGYLLDQFFWDRTNHRTDAYGGTMQRRTNFPAKVVRAVRNAVGPEFPILYRFSQWKIGNYDALIATNPSELETLLSPLADAGVDIFDCSTRRHWEAAFAGDQEALSLPGWTRRITGRPVIGVGSIGVTSEFHSAGDRLSETVEDRLAKLGGQFDAGEFDLVALGRAVLADPAWVNKVRAGAESSIIRYRRS